MQHLDFFLNSAVGMGFKRCKMGFTNKTGWEMGLVPPLHDRLDDAVVKSARLVDTSDRAHGYWTEISFSVPAPHCSM